MSCVADYHTLERCIESYLDRASQRLRLSVQHFLLSVRLHREKDINLDTDTLCVSHDFGVEKAILLSKHRLLTLQNLPV